MRRVANGEVVMPPIPRDVFEAAVAKLDDEDLPVFAMLLDREPQDSIAHALRVDPAEIAGARNGSSGASAPARYRRRRSGDQGRAISAGNAAGGVTPGGAVVSAYL